MAKIQTFQTNGAIFEIILDKKFPNYPAMSWANDANSDKVNLSYYFGNSTNVGLTTSMLNAFQVAHPGSGTTFVPTNFTSRSQNVVEQGLVDLYNITARLEFSPVTSGNNAELTFFMGSGSLVSYSQTNSAGNTGIALYPGDYRQGGSSSDYASFIAYTDNLNAASTSPEIGGGSLDQWNIIHELGHAMGFTHVAPFGNAVPLDGTRYTVMSGKVTPGPNGPAESFGQAVGFMALDIAALHYLYGAGDNNIGDTEYKLGDGANITGPNALHLALDLDGSDNVEQISRAYRAIYDKNNTNKISNIDKISYNGSEQSAWINLNDASLSLTLDTNYQTLLSDVKASNLWTKLGATGRGKAFQNELDASVNSSSLKAGAYHAGGFFSQLFTYNSNGEVIHLQDGGYSIANGTVIEDAIGGDKADVLIGNEFDNELNGRDGDDVIFGGAGDDRLYGGARGDDTLYGGTGNDTAVFYGWDSNYQVTGPSGGTQTVTAINAATGGTDTLIGIEKIEYDHQSCFAAGTLITLNNYTQKPIEEITVGDTVLSFNEAGDLVPGRVTQLLDNVTEEWLKLSNETVVTPGHRYLRPDGSFMEIKDIIEKDGLIVDVHGEVIQVTAERIVYSAETAHLFETHEKLMTPTGGSAAFAPEIKNSAVFTLGNLKRTQKFWRTYNFTVAETHTYITDNDNSVQVLAA